MKPASFKYLAPNNIDEILALLSCHGENAKILAGGQSLVPVLNFRLGAYDCLIDINGAKALSYIRIADGWLHIGPLTRQREIETSSLVREAAPLLSEVTRHIAHLPIRTRGTIGGSLSHADPAAEDPAAMLALDAVFDLTSRETRSVRADEFFTGPLETVMATDELLTNIRIPLPRTDTSFAFEEVSRRRGDFAIIGIAVKLTWAGERIKDARIACCGLESGAVRFAGAEQLLEGEVPSQELVAEAAQRATEAAVAQDDLHATAEYRRHLVGQLVRDVVAQAIGSRQ